MKAVTRFGIVENAGPNHLRGYLKQEAAKANAVDIGVAFVTEGGLAVLLPVLKKATTRGPVRVLTGLYQGFTDPKALRLLLAQQIDTEGKLAVRLSTNGHFHWKTYILHHNKSSVVVIGSSNLTAEGLGQSGELNAAMTMQKKSSALQALMGTFEGEWSQGVPLSQDRIDRYVKLRQMMPKVPPLPLGDILGKMQKRERIEAAKQDDSGKQFWRSFTEGYASGATAQIITETTDWDERGYWWFTSGDPRYRRGDLIVLFDHSSKWVQLVKIIGTTSPPGGTPDGRHFTAYERVRGSHRRRLDKSLISDLIRAGLLKDKSQAKWAKKLTTKTFQALVEHLRLN